MVDNQQNQYHSKDEGSFFSGDFLKHPSENVGLLPGTQKSIEERKDQIEDKIDFSKTLKVDSAILNSE